MDNNAMHLDFTGISDQDKDKGQIHRFDHQAMHTQFEILTTHPEPYYASQVAHEAFLLLDHLEYDLSRFISNSDISRINRSPFQLILISEDTIQCLRTAQIMEEKTNGYFNIIIGRIIDLYKNQTGQPIDIALSAQKHLELDMDRYLASLTHDQAIIDLGGIAKGFAIDRMTALLRDWDIQSALIHGGQSTVYAYGDYDDQSGWPVSISDPFQEQGLDIFRLDNQALSASGLEKGSHIINPKTKQPVAQNQASWAITTTAIEADALSTAFMIMTKDEISSLCQEYMDYGGLKLIGQDGGSELYHFGILES
ncbi:FAD:protein FMN transferase [bacterium]